MKEKSPETRFFKEEHLLYGDIIAPQREGGLLTPPP